MWEERVQLKATLYQFALEHHQSAPNFIRNKLVKLVVDIARLDWPHFYPDFFSNILQVKVVNKEWKIYFISLGACLYTSIHIYRAPEISCRLMVRYSLSNHLWQVGDCFRGPAYLNHCWISYAPFYEIFHILNPFIVTNNF